MKKIVILLLGGLAVHTCIRAQRFYFPGSHIQDSAALQKAMPVLAEQLLTRYRENDRKLYRFNLLRLQLVAAKYQDALATIHSARKTTVTEPADFPALKDIQFESYAAARLREKKAHLSFSNAFSAQFGRLLDRLDDKTALGCAAPFNSMDEPGELKRAFMRLLAQSTASDSIRIEDALALCNSYCQWKVYEAIMPLAIPLLAADDRKRYIIDDQVLVTTKGGATIAVVVARKRKAPLPLPAAMVFTIYAEKNNAYYAKLAAAYGYAGVLAFSRGKAWSTDSIAPYEHEVTDVNSVISWVVKQPWSNGKLGMYGGSYNGFSQWAATKKIHPALKTIVPYVAAIPGIGLPMENNVFLNANYGWAFYVTNNRYLDNAVYFNPSRWRTMQNKWYNSGVAYRSIDSVDNAPNPWLQRWLQHPDYDQYWQSLVPYKEAFAGIHIPVLTIEGYYDDGQISGLHYLQEHYRYNRQAEHYLLIGPYDHFGAQRGGTSVLRGYTVDPVALISTRDITFAWLDYILRGGPRPALLKDKINFEVMGANEWRHVPSLEQMNNDTLSFYLSGKTEAGFYTLSPRQPAGTAYLQQEVDLASRASYNNDYYPSPIIRDSLDRSNGLFFLSEPVNRTMDINGCFTGSLTASINKKDMDIGVVLYEVLPDGRYFHLSYFLGRASYAADMTTRHLLTPGQKTTITFSRTRMVSRRLQKGSRLLVVLNINKNPFAQVNYGSGKDVSDETIHDAGEPLQIKWYNNSFVKIPVWK